MIKPLLLGEAPSSRLRHQWDRPLSGPIAKRICELAGIPTRDGDDWYEVLLSLFDCRNAIEKWEDAYPWTVETSRAARRRWIQFVFDRRENEVLREIPLVVVCLGTKAASALHWPAEWFVWDELEYLHRVMIPHPSGLNHMYNDPQIRLEARKTLLQAIGKQIDLCSV